MDFSFSILISKNFCQRIFFSYILKLEAQVFACVFLRVIAIFLFFRPFCKMHKNALLSN